MRWSPFVSTKIRSRYLRRNGDRAVELLRAGSISKVDLAQLESQLSTDKYQLVVAQTNLDNYKLQFEAITRTGYNRRDRIGDAGAYGERYLNPASEQANDLQYLSGRDAANKEQ